MQWLIIIILCHNKGTLADTSQSDPGQPLVQYLRRNMDLKGTKSNCDGGCTGNCTVVMSKWNARTEGYDHRAVSSCCLPLGGVHKSHITTVEGVGSDKNPHPLQQRLYECHAVQCGYDTPGFVMAAYALLVQRDSITIQDIIEHLDGVFSRCNGYRSVVEALQHFEGSTNNEREKLEENIPDELKVAPIYPVEFIGHRTSWMIVKRMEDAAKHSDRKLFYGIPNTSKLSDHVVVVVNDGKVVLDDCGIMIDMNCTITNLVEILKTKLSGLNDTRQQFIQNILSIFGSMGSTQLRNTTSVGDSIQEWDQIRSVCTLLQSDGKSNKNCVSIPWLSDNEKFGFERITNRKANTSSVVCAFTKLSLKASAVEKISLFVSYGHGVNKTIEAKKTAAMIMDTGKITDDIKDTLKEDIGSQENCLLLTKLIEKMMNKLGHNEDDKVQIFERMESTQYQEFVYGLPDEDIEPLGKPVPHIAGLRCTTGQAVFVDDMPSFRNELFMEFVTSTEAHARIKKIDASKAVEIPGVKYFLTYKDVPNGKNLFPLVGSAKEMIFAEDTVVYEGQPIGAILATDETIAKRAALLVKIEYEKEDTIVSLDDALEANSFFPVPGYFPIQCGEPEDAITSSNNVIEGIFETPRQEHLYEETLSMLVVPIKENNELKVYCPTPNAFMMQTGIAKLLGISANRVTVIVKRIGCNFGGKVIRCLPYAYAVSLAAYISGVPVRSVLSREQDMRITGQRGEFRGRYKVGITEGKIKGVDYMFLKNGGFNNDSSQDILTCALVHSDNCYKFDSFHGTGKVAKTNTPSNSAFRAYGAPPAFVITENMMFDVATELNLDQLEFRRNNFYRAGDITHFGQVLTEDDVTFEACFEECIKRSNYHRLKLELEEFNAMSKTKKRGMSLNPFQYGVGIPPTFGQAGALLNVNIDGSILIFVGGVEMGQGFYTKMVQIASQELRVPMTKIHISESSTDCVPNPNISGGSSTADFSGNAVRLACQELNKRLAPFKEVEPKGLWEQWIGMAYSSRVSLSVTAHYAIPHEFTEYSFDKKEGNRWAYFVTGATCSVVEIDTLTGEHTVLRTEIVMDAGESLNPAIDTSQVEGAYVQGYGYLAMENTVYSSTGALLTRGHSSYTAPSIRDIPPVFNVTLLRKHTPVNNRRVLYSSKGIGEPPFLCGASVFFAIKSAVLAARADRGVKGVVKLATPAIPSNVVNAIYL